MEIGRLVYHTALYFNGSSRLVQHLRSQLCVWWRKLFRPGRTTRYAIDLDGILYGNHFHPIDVRERLLRDLRLPDLCGSISTLDRDDLCRSQYQRISLVVGHRFHTVSACGVSEVRHGLSCSEVYGGLWFSADHLKEFLFGLVVDFSAHDLHSATTRNGLSVGLFRILPDALSRRDERLYSADRCLRGALLRDRYEICGCSRGWDGFRTIHRSLYDRTDHHGIGLDGTKRSFSLKGHGRGNCCDFWYWLFSFPLSTGQLRMDRNRSGAPVRGLFTFPLLPSLGVALRADRPLCHWFPRLPLLCGLCI